jgi:threonine dehydrogenase-like Zn-dependent dehydrogenase
MKALAVFPAGREVRVIDEPAPAPPSGTQVLLRILDVGVCGTDREICSFHYGLPPQGADHLVLGHESLAEVVAVGPDVKGVSSGDLVVPMVRRPCERADCRSCRAGRQDFCSTGEFKERGIKQADGFMTELVVEEERYLVPVPAALREVAVLVEPLTIAAKALVGFSTIQQRMPWDGGARRQRALVLGAGPVGLLGAMALVVEGFDTFIYARKPPDSLQGRLTSAIGATYLRLADHPVDALAEVIGDIDLVFEAAGVSQLAFASLCSLGPNGVFIFSGVPGPHAPTPVDTDGIMRNIVLKNQIVLGTVNAGRVSYEHSVELLTRFMKQFPEAVRQLITGRSPIDDYERLLLHRSAGIKNVIQLEGAVA